jgi:imidazolonepropionase-like amidohydrolase
MKKCILFNICLFLILSSIIACNKTKNPTSDGNGVNKIIAITNGFLIDGTGSDPIVGVVIIIEEEYIKSVGILSSTDIPDKAEIIDAQGYYILPGFINTHVHNAYHESNLKEWAKSGVTTVRDLGNFITSPEQGFSIRDTLLKNNKNARLVAAGPLVTTVGGYGNYSVTSTTDAEIEINHIIAAGADLIKIAIEDNLQGRTWPMLSSEEINKIVQITHNQNKQVSAHISRSKHLEIAIDCGVDDVAHMIVDNLPDTQINAMIEQNIYWVPTLELWQGVRKIHNINWDTIAKNNLCRFVQAGGKVALGTDYDGYIFEFELGMPLLEMQLMQGAGMTPNQVIVAATKHAAHVCNLENLLGTIEPGKIADIIIIKENPLEDLKALGNIQIVIHNGEIIKNDL